MRASSCASDLTGFSTEWDWGVELCEVVAKLTTSLVIPSYTLSVVGSIEMFSF